MVAQYGPSWIESVAYVGALHFLLWDISATYKAWLKRLWAELRDRLQPVKTRIVGRLARDVDAAMRQAGI